MDRQPDAKPPTPLPPRLRLLQLEGSEEDAAEIRAQFVRAGVHLHWQRVETDAAFAAAMDSSWDLVIAEFLLPRIDGLAAFARFRERELETPFIFVSSAVEDTTAAAAMRAGVRNFVPRDEIDRLLPTVARELHHAGTARRERASRQRAQRERYRLAAAVQATGAGIFEHAKSPPYNPYVSDRLLEIFGIEGRGAPAVTAPLLWLMDAVHSDDWPDLERMYSRVLRGEQSRLRAEARVRHTDGRWLHVTVFATALRDDDGTTRFVGVVLDESPRRMLEDQLRQSKKLEAIGQLAGGIAHDFNNLLTAILGFAQFAGRRLEPEHPARDDLEHILRAGRRAERLTGQLLAFSRRKDVRPRAVDLNAVVSELDSILRTLLGAEIEIELNLADDLWSTTIDPEAVEQVIVNLIVNARDAMPDGGKVTIESANVVLDARYGDNHGVRVPPGDYAALFVSDSGTGMDRETLRRIFDPFFTTKEVGKGTGLGLSTCYGIIKQAGGFLWAYSEPGLGATFKVYLPRSDQLPEVLAHVREPEVTTGTETILLAEDDEQVRLLVVSTLENHGYRVITAGSGDEAMRKAARFGHEVDLLLTDVIMPDCSGPRIAEQLVAVWPRLRVLFMSGYTANAMADRGLLDPDARLLRKPFMPADLLREVRVTLAPSDRTP